MTTTHTTEKAFEIYVEQMLCNGGWSSGTLSVWDKDRPLFPTQICAFIQDTQPKLWEEMKALHQSGLEPQMLATLCKELDAKGSLHVLRHGFKFHGKLFRLAYFQPAHGGNYETLELCRKNRLTVTRQVPCHPGDNRTLDMLLALNGLPIASIKLKNPGTGQSWRNAINQFKEDRDPRALLFDFKKRALVHFAANPDEVCMTMRLAGDTTHFLPLNRVSHPVKIICGAGNPQHSAGSGKNTALCSANDRSFVLLRRFPQGDRCPPTERRTYVGEPLRRLAPDTAAKTLMWQKRFGCGRSPEVLSK